MRSVAVRVGSKQEVSAPSGRSIQECEANTVAGKFLDTCPLLEQRPRELPRSGLLTCQSAIVTTVDRRISALCCRRQPYHPLIASPDVEATCECQGYHRP